MAKYKRKREASSHRVWSDVNRRDQRRGAGPGEDTPARWEWAARFSVRYAGFAQFSFVFLLLSRACALAPCDNIYVSVYIYLQPFDLFRDGKCP